MSGGLERARGHLAAAVAELEAACRVWGVPADEVRERAEQRLGTGPGIHGCAVIWSTRGRSMPGGRSPRRRGLRLRRCGLAARLLVVSPVLAVWPRKRQ